MALFTKTTKDQAEKQEAPVEPVLAAAEAAANNLASGAGFSIIRPRISEKSAALSKLDKYVFLIKNTANKIEVKKAVEKAYKVHVTQVNIIRNKSKKVNFGRISGTRSGFKKAVITLRKGESIAAPETK